MLDLLTVTASIAIVPFFMDGGAPGRMNDSRKMLLNGRGTLPSNKNVTEGSAKMPTEEQMTVNDRRKYLNLLNPRYQKATRTEQSALLTEMQHVTGLHRKSLLRVLHASSLDRKPRTTQRQRSYGLAVEQVILKVWESLDYICAERLTPSLVPLARHLARFQVVQLTPEIEAHLATISRATVARLLQKHRLRKARLPRQGPERANQVTKDVPMGRIAWNIQEAGHFEVERVASCRRKHHGRVSTHLATRRCRHRME